MSIEDILQALDDQCRQECQEIFSRAEAEAKQILDKAQVEAEAIRQAIAEAEAGDVVVVAGKGHEDYQIVGTETRAFSDRETVQACLSGGAA